MDPAWIRHVRTLCDIHGVAFFLKQCGTYANNPLGPDARTILLPTARAARCSTAGCGGSDGADPIPANINGLRAVRCWIPANSGESSLLPAKPPMGGIADTSADPNADLLSWAMKGPIRMASKPSPTDTRPLNPRQQASFIREYLVEPQRNTSRPMRAGNPYAAKGAEVTAHRLLSNDKIQAAIANARNKRAVRLDITADRIMQEYARIAFADVTDVAQVKDGHPWRLQRSTGTLPPEKTAAISEVSENRSGALRVKMHNKIAALDSLAKHFGITPGEEIGPADHAAVDRQPSLAVARLCRGRARGETVRSAVGDGRAHHGQPPHGAGRLPRLRQNLPAGHPHPMVAVPLR